MLFIFINGSDRSSDVESKSLEIHNQIQQRSDSCSFDMTVGASAPSENQDLRIFRGDTIASASGTTVVLNGNHTIDTNMFYAGQKLHIGIGNSDEEIVTVDSYNASTLTITLTSSITGTHVADDKIGEIVFGGVVSKVLKRNVTVLDNLEFKITGVDYTKIFDKKLVSDTWEDVDSRYIINDFVNTTVNLNKTIDNLDYDNNAAIQSEWIQGGDGNALTIDSSVFIEGDASGIFSWTFSSGTATWAATPTSMDISDLIGAPSGTPVSGLLMLWLFPTDYTKITSIKVRIGSDASNYAELDIEVPTSNKWTYTSTKFLSATITGTPDWTAVDYAQIRIVQTASTSIKMNGLRVNHDNSFTLFNVNETPRFDDIRSPQLKPTSLMQTLAKTWEFVWYIDYNRDIYFKDDEAANAPFTISNTSNNFTDLVTRVDQSQLGNRIIIRGGEKTSASTYSQVFEGDGSLREWLMKAKFKNMVITIDNNTSTDTMEIGTTTTNVTATTHGLETGDHIVNRTRSNAVRQITKVDNNNFTVEAVTGQTSGDTFSKFDTSKTDGVEGLTDETTVDYVTNSNEKSVRATASEATLTSGNFIRFSYNERVPIQLQYTDSASVTALKALGLGDGVFDLDPITDRNIEDVGTALSFAQSKVSEYSNPIIDGSFITDQHGLKAGQLVSVIDTVRGLDDKFVIQKITAKQRIKSANSDYFQYKVVFGTTLFGWIEFMQKLLSTQDKIEINVDDVVETFASADEIVESADVNQTATDGGFKNTKNTETVETSETNTVYDATQWNWEPSVGQTLATRWDLFSWG